MRKLDRDIGCTRCTLFCISCSCISFHTEPMDNRDGPVIRASCEVNVTMRIFVFGSNDFRICNSEGAKKKRV